jgi:hypothetical protein
VKPAPFEYLLPESLEEAVAPLVDRGGGAKALTGYAGIVDAIVQVGSA